MVDPTRDGKCLRASCVRRTDFGGTLRHCLNVGAVNGRAAQLPGREFRSIKSRNNFQDGRRQYALELPRISSPVDGFENQAKRSVPEDVGTRQLRFQHVSETGTGRRPVVWRLSWATQHSVCSALRSVGSALRPRKRDGMRVRLELWCRLENDCAVLLHDIPPDDRASEVVVSDFAPPSDGEKHDTKRSRCRRDHHRDLG